MINMPRIAIPTPTCGDRGYNDRSWQNYADAVAGAGGEAVRVELGLAAAELHALMAGCDGVCLPGSPADVEPEQYGQERDPATAAADPAREAVDFALLEDALRHAKPVLAICFGVQSMNVWRRGTLVQDLTPLPVNHSAGRAVAVAHTVLVQPDSLYGSILMGDAGARAEAPRDGAPNPLEFLRLPVNTSHHQAVGEPGNGLRVVARCPDDGVIEAVEADAAVHPWMVGVQWHPERSVDISAASRALFAAFVRACAR